MKTYLVVTMTCPDRPGVVEQITEAVVKFSANWEDSRMARLGGDFAGIVKIRVAEENVAGLTAALEALADDETTVVVRTAHADAEGIQKECAMMDLRLTGADHEGIVHKVSAYLAGQGINVESMDTILSPAPMSATPLFHMEAVVKVPADLSLVELTDNLTHIGEELGVDIEVVPKGQDEA